MVDLSAVVNLRNAAALLSICWKRSILLLLAGAAMLLVNLVLYPYCIFTAPIFTFYVAHWLTVKITAPAIRSSIIINGES